MSAATEKPVNVAVVGLGFMGVTHLRAYLANPQARVVAVCDAMRAPVNGVLAGVSGNITKSDDIDLGPDVKVYRTTEELLADADVELVDICTPTPLHAAQVIAALNAGTHVICEKPLARTSAEAREILAIAAKSPGILMPAMCMRFWPGWSWLKQAVAEETCGKVQYNYPGGPNVYAEGSWLLNQGFNMSYTLLCENATIDFDLARGANALIVSETGKEPRVVETGDGDGYSKEIDYIIDCVAKRQAPAVVTALDGVTALEICEAEEQSIRRGASVKL